jgi:hypothetical protein
MSLRSFVRTNNPLESPEDYFRFNFGYDVVKDSEQIMKNEFPGWKLPEAFVKKVAREPDTLKAIELVAKKGNSRVSVRSIIDSFESIKV